MSAGLTGRYHPDAEINAGIAADALEAERIDLAVGYPPRRWECECGASHGRGRFMTVGAHRCLACGYVGTGGVMFRSSNPVPPSARDREQMSAVLTEGPSDVSAGESGRDDCPA